MPKRTEGKRLTKAQREFLKGTPFLLDGMHGSTWKMADALRKRGFVFLQRRRRGMDWEFALTPAGRTALKTGASE